MDPMLQIKVQNVLNEINHHLENEHMDQSFSRTLMSLAVNRISLLMTHIGFIESKLESTIESNQILATNMENLIAENQRLSQIAKY